ncbi:MAG: hypothetical protein QOI02_1470, partial [Actinomycetota bacterium]|nr:hypothetical protein [Actinomycetota bacterium]
MDATTSMHALSIASRSVSTRGQVVGWFMPLLSHENFVEWRSDEGETIQGRNFRVNPQI